MEQCLTAMVGVDLQRFIHRTKQVLLLDGLGEEVHRPTLERRHGLLNVAVACQEDDRVNATLAVQPRLHFETVLAGHCDVEQDAARHFPVHGEEAGRGVELARAISGRAQQPPQCGTHIQVVVENEDYGSRFGHCPLHRALH